MPVKYKIDILQTLKNAGYSTYRIRKDKLFGEATLQKIRNGELVSWENISTICRLLKCQPGDLVQYTENEPRTNQERTKNEPRANPEENL